MNGTTHGFEASLLHPDGGDEPVGGKLWASPSQVQFQAETVSLDIPLSNLQVEFEDGGKGLFLFDVTRPEVRIYTPNPSILRQQALRSLPQVAAVLSRRELNRALRLTLYFAGGCVLAVWLGSLAMSAMTSAIAAKIPAAWEQKMGLQAIDKLRANDGLLKNSNDVAQLTALAAPLIEVLPAGRRDLKFYIANDPDPNAFALPGGPVVVNTGLLQLTDQPEEILGVLAHELAHQIKRHALRHIISAAGPLVIFGLFLHSDNGMGRILTAGSGLMVFQGFSQDYETEADDTGWSYLVAARIDPRGMIHAFQKLEASEGKPGSHAFAPQALQSHPAIAQRIARLEKKWDKLGRKSDFLPLPPVHWSLTNSVAD